MKYYWKEQPVTGFQHDNAQTHTFETVNQPHLGVQWLSGRVLDSRPRGRRFEPHRRHCIVVLEQDTLI